MTTDFQESTAARLLSAARAGALRVAAIDGKLTIRGPKSAVEKFRGGLGERKAEILVLLAGEGGGGAPACHAAASSPAQNALFDGPRRNATDSVTPAAGDLAPTPAGPEPGLDPGPGQPPPAADTLAPQSDGPPATIPGDAELFVGNDKGQPCHADDPKAELWTYTRAPRWWRVVEHPIPATAPRNNQWLS